MLRPKDVESLPDKVDYFMLGNILLDRGLPIDVILLVMHYLRNQKARVAWDGEFGRYYDINEGVRQGGIMSPLLFKLYIDSLLSEINELDIGCKFGITRVNILAYADDLVLISNTFEDLEKLYIRLCEILDELKLILNRLKTKCMIFDSSRYGNDIHELVLGNDTIECVY